MGRSKKSGPPDFPLYVRLIVFAAGVLRCVGAMALFEVNLILSIVLFFVGIFVALTGVGYSRRENNPMMEGLRKPGRGSGLSAHARAEDVPLNPWDTVSALKSDDKKQQSKEPWE